MSTVYLFQQKSAAFDLVEWLHKDRWKVYQLALRSPEQS